MGMINLASVACFLPTRLRLTIVRIVAMAIKSPASLSIYIYALNTRSPRIHMYGHWRLEARLTGNRLEERKIPALNGNLVHEQRSSALWSSTNARPFAWSKSMLLLDDLLSIPSTDSNSADRELPSNFDADHVVVSCSFSNPIIGNALSLPRVHMSLLKATNPFVIRG